MTSKRFLIVPEDSSAARMPLPGATMACATLFNSSRFIFSSIASAAVPPDGMCSTSFYSQHLDPGQALTLEPFEKCTACGRDVGQPIGDPRNIECGDGVATTRYRDKLAGLGQFRGSFRDFDGAIVERLHLEGAERAIPHQCLRARQHGNNMFNAARADIQNHVGAADFVGVEHA